MYCWISVLQTIMCNLWTLWAIKLVGLPHTNRKKAPGEEKQSSLAWHKRAANSHRRVLMKSPVIMWHQYAVPVMWLDSYQRRSCKQTISRETIYAIVADTSSSDRSAVPFISQWLSSHFLSHWVSNYRWWVGRSPSTKISQSRTCARAGPSVKNVKARSKLNSICQVSTL
jgi:hypothetical protein